MVAGLLAPSYAPASPSKPTLTSPCPLAPSDSSEVTRAQWETTTTMLKTLMGDSTHPLTSRFQPVGEQWGAEDAKTEQQTEEKPE